MSKKKLSLYTVMEILGESIGENLADYVAEDEYEGGVSLYADNVANIIACEYISDSSFRHNVSNLSDVARNLAASLQEFAHELENLEEEYVDDDE